MVTDLVAAADDLDQRLGIQLAVDRLDEERGLQMVGVEGVEQPRQHVGHRPMAAQWLAGGPGSALELAGLAQIVKRQYQGAGQPLGPEPQHQMPLSWVVTPLYDDHRTNATMFDSYRTND